MDAQLNALLAALERAEAPEPNDIACSLRSLPEPGVLPSPWETWTLIGLVRHRDRQLWVAGLICNCPHGSPADLATLGAFAYSEGVVQSGTVLEMRLG